MKSEKPAAYLHFINSFRGFAVLCIVIGHAVSIAYITFFHKHNSADPLLIINEILFDACTLYFTLISGILFSAVLKQKGYLTFYRNKFLYIFLPYVFYTFVFVLLKMKWYRHFTISMDFAEYFSGKFIKDLVYGEGNFVLWYIPLFLCLCIITPLLDFLLHKNRFTQLVFCMLILSPLLLSRMETSATYTFKAVNVIYFAGAYALGMYWGKDTETKMLRLEKYRLHILIAGILASILLAYCYVNGINRVGFVFIRESLFYIQKICFSVIILLLLKKLGNKQPAVLGSIARQAMPVYFMHGVALILLAPVVIEMTRQESVDRINVFILSVLLSLLVIVIPVAIATLTKKVFGKQSRMFIGA